ncbi:hypothetical protein CAPTEDRAFT_194588 [Capitella teleta]|uniref:VWFA domain-containing protein n=1 Tax=Capitella teleta TaxID=283909 RepID=R7UN79_CAPTE|nr:hypothetical protein CAPTEDRAFT_194588 [Capitella teleta]|eukprot:ELU07989.1 hypothetical protein CAPTEDRAFT_194588 [Capitella teleta]
MAVVTLCAVIFAGLLIICEGQRHVPDFQDCEMDIVFVVDTSPSIGRGAVDEAVTNTIINMETQLARLPHSPQDNRQGSNLHLVMFGKNATHVDLKSLHADSTKIKRNIQQTLQADEIDGGSCIACGLEKAADVLSTSVNPKYIVLLTDGYNNDRSAVSAKTPSEVAQQAKADGVQVFTLGVVGNKESTDAAGLTSLASDPSMFWVVSNRSDSNFDAIAFVDAIAGDSCLRETAEA